MTVSPQGCFIEAGQREVEAGHRRPQHGGPVASTMKHKRNHTD